MRLIGSTVCLVLLLAACGGGTAAGTSASARPAPPTPSPRPDQLRLDTVEVGLGTYQLVTVPVAVVHNAAAEHDARTVVAHFATSRGGRPLGTLESVAVTVHPGQSFALVAHCTDGCNNADAVTATVTVGSWAAATSAALTVGPSTYACVLGCTGHGQGDATATLTAPSLGRGTRVVLTAVCRSAGAIVGGGVRQLLWPQPSGSATLDVPVIVSRPPDSCEVDATPA